MRNLLWSVEKYDNFRKSKQVSNITESEISSTYIDDFIIFITNTIIDSQLNKEEFDEHKLSDNMEDQYKKGQVLLETWIIEHA